MTHIIYKDAKKKVEVLEWIKINNELHPKHKKTTYFNPDDKPDFGQKPTT